jgi:hypothetical protein
MNVLDVATESRKEIAHGRIVMGVDDMVGFNYL